MIKEKILSIAQDLEDHIDCGEPYGLTFFYDKRVPLTTSQKKILEEYLAYHFHSIWGYTWIKGEASRLRQIAEAIRERTVQLTVLDEDALEEAGKSLEDIIRGVKERLGLNE